MLALTLTVFALIRIMLALILRKARSDSQFARTFSLADADLALRIGAPICRVQNRRPRFFKYKKKTVRSTKSIKGQVSRIDDYPNDTGHRRVTSVAFSANYLARPMPIWATQWTVPPLDSLAPCFVRMGFNEGMCRKLSAPHLRMEVRLMKNSILCCYVIPLSDISKACRDSRLPS